MAGVALAFPMISARVDELRTEVRKLREAGSQGSGADGSGTQNDSKYDAMRTDIERGVNDRAQMQKEIDELRDSQASSFKTERSVLEAVLSQKLDRSVSDRVAGVSKRVDELGEALQKAVDRASAITLAVDKQAKFLTDLNARMAETVQAAVARALEAQKAANEPLVSSPALDGDAIDVVRAPASPVRRSRAKTTKAVKKPTQIAAEEASGAGDGEESQDTAVME